MDTQQIATATACRDGAADDTMSFPDIVATLAAAGFEGYAVDFRHARATYYGRDGTALDLPVAAPTTDVAPTFDTAAMQAAVREAQRQVPGYTYKGFCEKAAAAGCAGYMVSLTGRRALYVGRTAETHVEHFP